jgi:hypothetical protein
MESLDGIESMYKRMNISLNSHHYDMFFDVAIALFAAATFHLDTCCPPYDF